MIIFVFFMLKAFAPHGALVKDDVSLLNIASEHG
jgi:hypothetical protein